MLQELAARRVPIPDSAAPAVAALAPAHRLDGAEPLGRLGSLEVRLACDAKDVRRAQRLRYRVFYRERSALGLAAHLLRRDADEYDAICEHLLVIDNAAGRASRAREPDIIGTYRLLRQAAAARHGGFYSAREFEIAPLLARHQGLNFLELGRSCVAAPYRNRRTVELLWHGIWRYVLAHEVDVMFGCASLEGSDPRAHASALSYLHHFAAAKDPWTARALPARRVAMDTLPAGALDLRAVWRDLPPLIKGYLRIGAQIGDGAVADPHFDTTDVLVVLPVAAIAPRYIAYFGEGAERHAA